MRRRKIDVYPKKIYRGKTDFAGSGTVPVEVRWYSKGAN